MALGEVSFNNDDPDDPGFNMQKLLDTCEKEKPNTWLHVMGDRNGSQSLPCITCTWPFEISQSHGAWCAKDSLVNAGVDVSGCHFWGMGLGLAVHTVSHHK